MPLPKSPKEDISIHAPREGSDFQVRGDFVDGLGISIHAPREGSDLFAPSPGRYLEISIHAPREGSDGRVKSQCNTNRNFNPRSP